MSEQEGKMEVDAAVPQEQEEETEEFEVLEALEESNAKDAMAKYLQIVETPASADNQDELVKRKEKAVRRLSKLYAANNEVKALEALIINIRPTLDTMSKAKGGQIFRLLIDAYLSFSNQTEAQVKMCLDCIEWAKNEKRNFLRQALEVKLQGLYYNAGQFQNCLQQIAPLLKELKRLDDKALLVDVQLIESKAFFALANYPKARASLVSARTTANGIYCPPKMQAALDLQSGVMHAQEGDFKTGYSYFYEAFEGFDSVDQKEQAVLGLKYMLLSKIMLSEARDVPSIISGKLALRYTGRDLEAMQSIANASLHRSLKEFEQALLSFEKELKGDRIIVSHLDRLYNALLQQNLARIVEPFSRVEIEHVAAVIERPRAVVEAKLSQMILDKQLFGILDQGAGCLEVFDESSSDKTYEVSLETVQQMGTVVDALFKRAQKIV